MRRVLSLKLIMLATASGSGSGSGKTSGVRKFFSGVAEVLKTLTGKSGKEEAAAVARRLTIQDVALGYIGGPSDDTVLNIQFSYGADHGNWGSCRDLESDENPVDLGLGDDEVEEFMNLVMADEILGVNRRLEVDLGDDGLFVRGRETLERILEACRNGWLTNWADSVEGSVCRRIDGDRKGEPVGLVPELLQCLSRQGANLSPFARKLYNQADILERDAPRMGFDRFIPADRRPEVVRICHELSVIWLTTIVPHYDYAQGAADLCMYLIGVRGFDEMITLRALTVYRNDIFHLTSYPLEVLRPYLLILGTYWQSALKTFFPDPFEDLFRDPTEMLNPFGYEMEVFMLRPTVVPEAVEFIMREGRPGFFAFYVAAITNCYTTLKRYMTGREQFIEAGNRLDDWDGWDAHFLKHVREILGDVVPIDGEIPTLPKFAKFYSAHPDHPNGARLGAIFGHPTDAICVNSGWQTGLILAKAREILDMRDLRNVKLAEFRSMDPAAVASKKGARPRTGPHGLAPDGVGWPEGISFKKLVALIDHVVEVRMEGTVLLAASQQVGLPESRMKRGSLLATSERKEELRRRTGLNLVANLPKVEGQTDIPGLATLIVFEDVTSGGECGLRVPKGLGLETTNSAVASAIRQLETLAPPVAEEEVQQLEVGTPLSITVDGVERVRRDIPRYDEMLARLGGERDSCVAGGERPFFPHVSDRCLRPILTSPAGCMRESITIDAITRNHAFVLERVAYYTTGGRHAAPVVGDCVEILEVYSVALMNSPDAMMDGEPLKWCEALRSGEVLTKDQTVRALVILGNKVTGQTKFGPKRSRQYLYTLASYWLMALKSLRLDLVPLIDGFDVRSGENLLDFAVESIRSFGGCLGSDLVPGPLWSQMRKRDLFALFTVRIESVLRDGKAADCKTVLQGVEKAGGVIGVTAEGPWIDTSVPIALLVPALDTLVDGAMQLNQL
jgi:hypothetical protein